MAVERAVEWVAVVVGWTVLVTGLVALVYTLGIYAAWMVVRWLGRSPRRRAWPLLALFIVGLSLPRLAVLPAVGLAIFALAQVTEKQLAGARRLVRRLQATGAHALGRVATGP